MTAIRPPATLSLPLLLLLTLLLASCSSDSRPSPHHTLAVTIDNSRFQPPVLTVHVGDTVEWKNNDIVPHTATAADATVFDSGRIAAGSAWKYVPARKGLYPYECSFHPNMQGQLIVQ